MKKLFRNPIFTFILGALLFATVGVAAATILNGSQIQYTGNKVTGASNIQQAIDTLYDKAANAGSDACPGPRCVYSRHTEYTYSVNSTNSSKTSENSKLSDSSIISSCGRICLGYLLDENGFILESYVCGTNSSKLFCLKGVDSSISGDTYKPVYMKNVDIINDACSRSYPYTDYSVSCMRQIQATADSDGGLSVNYGTIGTCFVNVDGSSYCSLY